MSLRWQNQLLHHLGLSVSLPKPERCSESYVPCSSKMNHHQSIQLFEASLLVLLLLGGSFHLRRITIPSAVNCPPCAGFRASCLCFKPCIFLCFLVSWYFLVRKWWPTWWKTHKALPPATMPSSSPQTPYLFFILTIPEVSPRRNMSYATRLAIVKTLQLYSPWNDISIVLFKLEVTHTWRVCENFVFGAPLWGFPIK